MYQAKYTKVLSLSICIDFGNLYKFQQKTLPIKSANNNTCPKSEFFPHNLAIKCLHAKVYNCKLKTNSPSLLIIIKDKGGRGGISTISEVYISVHVSRILGAVCNTPCWKYSGEKKKTERSILFIYQVFIPYFLACLFLEERSWSPRLVVVVSGDSIIVVCLGKGYRSQALTTPSSALVFNSGI